MVVPLYVATANFNPRSPHGERPSYHFSRFTSKIFQSTLPARGATCPRCRWGRPFHFNPRSPHGERRKAAANRHVAGYFNPRSPHGERRRLRAHCQRHSHFNPRSPHGERRIQAQRGLRQGRFQSTLPARGATSGKHGESGLEGISIHAPRTGSDASPPSHIRLQTHFNPRSPHGERRYRPDYRNVPP